MKNAGIECPGCGGVNTPSSTSGFDIENNRIRKRHCEECGEWFTTVELAVPGFAFHRAVSGRKGRVRRVDPEYLRVTRGDASLSVRVVPVHRIPLCRRRLHLFTGDNIYTTPKGLRLCRECKNARARELYHHARRKAPKSILEEQRAKWRRAHYRKRERAA